MVQKELETLEKAGVIIRSISPWASPIVVVPKKTEPGEPPRRRPCVDYRVINSLLPEVQKAHSKAKGILTLVPLPQIDHIYARLRGSQIFSTFDLRSGYITWNCLQRLGLNLLLSHLWTNLNSPGAPLA